MIIKKSISTSLFLLILLTACAPISDQIRNLVDSSLPQVFDGHSEDFPASDFEFKPTDTVYGFGMGSGTLLRVNDIDHAFADMAAMGVRYVREEFPMANIQVSPDFYDFVYPWNFNRMIESANRHNLEILGLLTYGPDINIPYADDEAFLTLWEDYVSEVVDRYGDVINYWQVGNEMNSLEFWRNVRKDASYVEVDIYARMLESAYRIVKNRNPNALVILGGLINEADFTGGYSPLSFMFELSKHSSSRYFDVVGLHTYWGSDMPESRRPQLIKLDYRDLTMTGYIQVFSDEIEQLYGERLPVWITEVGYDQEWLYELANRYNLPPAGAQAIVLARVYTALLSIPEVEAVFWYTYENDKKPDKQFAITPESKAVYQTLSELLTGTAPLGQYAVYKDSGQIQENAYEYRFQKPDGNIISVYWKNIPGIDFLDGKITRLVSSPAAGYKIDQGMDFPGIIIDEDLTHLGIFEKPEIIIGKMDDSTQLVINQSRSVQLYFLHDRVLQKITPDTLQHEVIFREEILMSVNISPDGQYLAYVPFREGKSSGQLNVYSLTIGQDMPFDGLPDDVDTFFWGPDPGQITFTKYNSEYCESFDGEDFADRFIHGIYILDLQTGNTKTLIQDSDSMVYYAREWSFDHQQLLYNYGPNCSSGWGAALIDPDSLSIEPLPCRSCSWSPDATSIAGTDHAYYVREDLPLEKISLPEKGVQTLFEKPGLTASSPLWSPRGDWIAFSVYDDHLTRTMLINPESGNLLEISITDAWPVLWHPDGDQLLIIDYDLGGGERMYLYDLENESMTLLFESNHGRSRGHQFIEQ